MTREDAERKIRSFSELKSGWDSYGAIPISTDAIRCALAMLSVFSWREEDRHLHVAPTSSGGVVFEDVFNDCIITIDGPDDGPRRETVDPQSTLPMEPPIVAAVHIHQLREKR